MTQGERGRRVVVVGAGPVGLSAAAVLAQHGIDVVVLEAEDAPNREWRASTFHSATLELLEPLGIVEDLVGLGIRARFIDFRDRERGVYARFDHRLLAGDTRHPYRLQLPQSTYCLYLADRLARRSGVDIRFGHRVVGLGERAGVVEVRCETPAGPREVAGAFAVAADGARSAVRRLLDIDFGGYTYAERLLLLGTTLDLPRHLPGIADVNYVSEPDGFYMILHVPAAWRFILSVEPEGPIDDGALLDRVRAISGVRGDIPVVERMPYHFHQRVADRFHRGRVALAGDAAHVNSPFGGLGMNSGIHDAVDLGERLARLLGAPGADPEPELDAYTEARRRVALESVRSITERNTQRLQYQDQALRRRLQDELAETAADPDRARRWLLQSSLLASVREQGIGRPPQAGGG